MLTAPPLDQPTVGGDCVGVDQRPDDLGVDLITDVALALELCHIGEASPRG
ncbi:hypothetical protein [Nitrosococcus watsonii]|uniref:hypothetical protein n=1 Tax=Nitrosococcus watsonii TaxID=473531 RepID=UPI0002F0A009|nr:hypothetical protein [Nitrosococcus watsonii]